MKGELQKNNQLKICKTSSYICYKFKNKLNVSSNTWYENEYHSNMPAVKNGRDETKQAETSDFYCGSSVWREKNKFSWLYKAERWGLRVFISLNLGRPLGIK